VYRINAQALEPIHDWVKNYERSWSKSFDDLDVVVQELKDREQTEQQHREQENGDDGSDQ
jgi:hypothetical protein